MRPWSGKLAAADVRVKDGCLRIPSSNLSNSSWFTFPAVRLLPRTALWLAGRGSILVSVSIAFRAPLLSTALQDLYLQHCASCHGESGDGSTPLAALLVTPPSDLRKIAARNGDRFDESDFMAHIDGRKNVAAHGPRAMPVWGAGFEEEE